MDEADRPSAETPGAMDRATETVQAATSTAKDRGRDVMAVAAEQSGRIVDEARAQAQNVMGDAREQLYRQLNSQSDKLRDGLHQLRGQLEALSSGRVEEAGPITGYLHSMVDQLDRVEHTLDTRGLQGIWHDTESFARRKPGTFLLGAGVVGFVAGRALRAGSSQSSSTDSVPRPESTFGQPTVGTPPVDDITEIAPPYVPGAGGDMGRRSA